MNTIRFTIKNGCYPNDIAEDVIKNIDLTTINHKYIDSFLLTFHNGEQYQVTFDDFISEYPAFLGGKFSYEEIEDLENLQDELKSFLILVDNNQLKEDSSKIIDSLVRKF